MRKALLLIITVVTFASCQFRQRGGGERQRKKHDTERISQSKHSGKPMKIKMVRENGVLVVPVKVNGVQMSFIFDTGASDITISQTEAQFLAKQGLLTQQDVIGKQQYQIADGSFSEGTIRN